MSSPSKSPAELLGKSLFASLQEQDRHEIAAMLRPRRFGAGQVIFGQDEPGSTLYLIEQGEVKLTLSGSDGREMVLATLGPGDLFGELALLDGQAHQTDALARVPSQLWVLQRSDLLPLLERRPVITIQLLALVVQRLRRSTQLAYDVVFLDVPARLARALLELARPDGSTLAIASKPTQSELAAMIGTTRESVNKWLSTFERMGLIRAEGSAIVLLRPDDLRRRVL